MCWDKYCHLSAACSIEKLYEYGPRNLPKLLAQTTLSLYARAYVNALASVCMCMRAIVLSVHVLCIHVCVFVMCVCVCTRVARVCVLVSVILSVSDFRCVCLHTSRSLVLATTASCYILTQRSPKSYESIKANLRCSTFHHYGKFESCLIKLSWGKT